MGHRANLVVVQDGLPTVRYDHWAAHDLSDRLVLGPAYTLRWVCQQERVDDRADGGWLDEVWSQGGLTMDLEQRRLVWYDMPAGLDLVRRRVVAALLARTWAGWTVEWAYEGIRDLAAAAGVPPERVRNPDIVDLIIARAPREVALREDPPGSKRWSPVEGEPEYHLVTVAGGGDLWVSLVDQACHAAWLGSGLVARVLAAPAVTRGNAAGIDLGGHDPRGGVHVDLDVARMSYWSTTNTYGLSEHVADRWGPEFEIVFLQDRIADHLALAGGFVTRQAPDMAAALREFLGDLARTHGTGQVHPAIQALEALESVLPAVPAAVNPAIADHHPMGAAADELAAVIAHAGALLREYGSGA